MLVTVLILQSGNQNHRTFILIVILQITNTNARSIGTDTHRVGIDTDKALVLEQLLCLI